MLSLDDYVTIMKVAVVILGNRWICPYVNTYTRMLDEAACDYDIILWDRDGSDANMQYAFSARKRSLKNPIVKFCLYLSYARFIKKCIEANRYDRLIVSGPHLAILLSSFLRKRYKKRYIVDYRDVSIEQIPLLYGRFSKVLASSACNVISSPGFRRNLPPCFKYLISHNFNVNDALRSLEMSPLAFDVMTPIRVLTIGAIRNYSSNVKVITALGNNIDYSLSFAGSGEAVEKLMDYVAKNNIRNVSFSGFYEKETEAFIVRNATFVNILFPDDKKHSTIMSNRFYLALAHKKPVIVTRGSTQAAYVEKYKLGVVIGDSDNLDYELKAFLSGFDYDEFCKNCNRLLAEFVAEHSVLADAVRSFLS